MKQRDYLSLSLLSFVAARLFTIGVSPLSYGGSKRPEFCDLSGGRWLCLVAKCGLGKGLRTTVEASGVTGQGEFVAPGCVRTGSDECLMRNPEAALSFAPSPSR